MKAPNPEKLEKLSLGLIETGNLMDAIYLNYRILMAQIYPKLTLSSELESLKISKKLEYIAAEIYAEHGFEAFYDLQKHDSDTARALSCFLLRKHDLSLSDKLNLIKPLADDRHFGVREWAFMAVRPMLIISLKEGLALLSADYVSSDRENLRRFAVEVTRPRGVWCAHIEELKTSPEKAIHLLNPLKSDRSLYVRKALGNWLNDAGKTRPDFVKRVISDWLSASKTKETEAICKRAMRNL